VSSLFADSVARANCVVMLRPDTPLTPAQIARLAGERSVEATRSALLTLEKRGVVKRSRVAGRDAFAPDRDVPAQQVAHAAALVDLPWAESLREAGVRLGRIRSIVVHGSMARGHETASSDLDVLVVAAVERSDIIAAFRPIEDLIGRSVDPVVISSDELQRRIDAGDRAIAEIASGGEGALWVAGERIDAA
jgi:predicted nucleotidyltransferase